MRKCSFRFAFVRCVHLSIAFMVNINQGFQKICVAKSIQ